MIVSVWNIWNDFPEVELSPGEEICPKCKGKGVCLRTLQNPEVPYKICHTCMGNGKVDWISRIVKATPKGIGREI